MKINAKLERANGEIEKHKLHRIQTPLQIPILEILLM